MRILTYRGLDTASIPGLDKLIDRLSADDFRSAEVKKIGDNLFRARLDRSNRLLFSLYRHEGECFALLLEYIPRHAYDKSRFLARGAQIDEERIPAVTTEAAEQAPELGYLNPEQSRFHLLDKVLSFDEDQEAIYRQPSPLIIIGSAGSGKTALTLEKMKDADGDILYVTRSAFLVENARELYYANGWQREDQNIDFLSFREFLETIEVPSGKEITPRAFAAWAARQHLPRDLKDSHRVFEEFQGAISGSDPDKAFLDRQDYRALGVRQSIFAEELRGAVYDLFEKYRHFLLDQGWFDANLVSHAWLDKIQPRYDFVVVDEVQDLTNVQLLLILRALRDPTRFLLCGDANQIVHPNFFSWAKLKTLFWSQQGRDAPSDLIRILNANFRNSPQVTSIANTILRIKHARFGSIDRESTYLVNSRGPTQGRVGLLRDTASVKRELDRRTAQSTRFAILVLHPEQKAEVREYFRTPLVFSIHEAKGLEYDNVLLYGFLSSEEKRFRDIVAGLDPSDLQGELRYARGRDKTDKSLEIYKFYINALYVAVTRAVKNLYLIESRPKQQLLDLLGLTEIHDRVDDVEEHSASLEEWRREAHRLTLQGKEEQAAGIRDRILKQRTPDWTVLRGEALTELRDKALERGHRKAGIALLEYALVYHDQRLINALTKQGLKAASQPDKALGLLDKKHFQPYSLRHPNAVLRAVDQYGVDHRNVFDQTPLMIASRMGNADLIAELLDRDADTTLVDANGLNSFQIALDRACADERFARIRLPAVFERLAPPTMDIQVDGRLIKLPQRLMEYLLLSIAMVHFYQRLGENYGSDRRLMPAADIEDILSRFPEAVVPARRKKRPYISSILAKNEVNRDDPYNRKLFLRWRRGEYILNPKLALRVEDQWRPIYELLQPQRLSARLRDTMRWGNYVYDPNSDAEAAINRLQAAISELNNGQEIEQVRRPWH